MSSLLKVPPLKIRTVMHRFFKSTYGQLTIMFTALLLVNFAVVILTFRYFTFGPAAKQMAQQINNQVSLLEQLLKNNTIRQAQTTLDHVFSDHQIIIAKKPEGDEFPPLQFYQELQQKLNTRQIESYLLQTDSDPPRLWMKPVWSNDYWLGFSFHSYIGNLSYLFFGMVMVLLMMTIPTVYFFSRYMLKPLRQLASMAASIVKGKEITESFQIRGTTEVQNISQMVKNSALQVQKFHKEKEILLAGVSHDLRTPLARMRLQLEFLSDEEARDNMIQEIDEMNQIIESFIGFVKLGAEEKFQQLDLRELVENSIDSYPQKEIRFTSPSTAVIATVKPLSIKRMLTNIYDNAFKYGNPPVHINLQSNKKETRIVIYDHGNGVKETDMKKIFEPFFMSDSRESKPGTGLGLSIVKKLAEQNHAEVIAGHHENGGLQIEIIFKKRG